MSHRIPLATAAALVVMLVSSPSWADCDACLPTFVQVPDFIVSGDGSCVHGGVGPGGGPPTDKLTVTLPDDPKCHQCTVQVTASWGPGAGDMETSAKKGPGTHVALPPATVPYWPHDV